RGAEPPLSRDPRQGFTPLGVGPCHRLDLRFARRKTALWPEGLLSLQKWWKPPPLRTVAGVEAAHETAARMQSGASTPRSANMNEFLTTSSEHPVRETMDRLEAAARERGMMIFARIDHQAGARSAGLTLRPNELLIFGNPNFGTRLIQARAQVGID